MLARKKQMPRSVIALDGSNSLYAGKVPNRGSKVGEDAVVVVMLMMMEGT